MASILGNKYGLLTVIEEYPAEKKKNRYVYKVKCICDCGNYTIVSRNNIVTGCTTSCGCIQTKQRSINGKQNKKYNKYDLSGEYGIGYTSKGEEFYFDLDDYDKIKDYYWSLNYKGYVTSNTDKNHYTIMHRLIMGVNDSNNQIDHISNNKTDNRKINLRIVNNSKNRMNVGLLKNNNSGYTGVSFNSHLQKWRARIQINHHQIFLGYFEDINDAIKTRKEAEEKYFGEFSYDNSQKYSKSYSEIGKEPSCE